MAAAHTSETAAASTALRLRGRYLIIGFVLLNVLIEVFHRNSGASLAAPWQTLLELFIYSVGFALLIVALLRIAGLTSPRLLGPAPGAAGVKHGAIFAVFLWLLAPPITYAVFYPLSLIAPEFVDFWLLGGEPSVYVDGGQLLLAANIASFVLAVVISPVVEEFAFRGILLQRWARRYGTWPGVLGSSVLFGILHADAVSATIFGVALCLLYMRFATLWLPIICHLFYNLFAWLYQAWSVATTPPPYDYSLAEFQADWPQAAVAALLVLVWSWVIVRRGPVSIPTSLPNV